MDDAVGLAGCYHGDTALSALLKEAGSPYDTEGVKSLLAGVLAAPVGYDPAAWLRLVAPRMTPTLATQLAALRAECCSHRSEAVLPQGQARLAALRAELAKQGVDGFLVPRADEHQGEYVPACARRLAWLTGFTGSAGLAVVLPGAAAIFVDGRYTLQAETEVDGALFARRHLTEEPSSDWIAATLKQGQILGYDPWLHTIGEIERYRAAAERAGGRIKALDDNPIDKVWTGRPPQPLAPVTVHEESFAGESAETKRRSIAERLKHDLVDAAVLTAPDSIAWLLNIRGGDVAHTPLPLSFALIRSDASVDLFIDRRKLTPEIAPHLGESVALRDPAEFGPALEQLAKDRKHILADPGSAPAAVFDKLQSGARLLRAADPCSVPKACKNAVELAGTRAAHRRDGAALARFFAWLAREAPKGGLREILVSDRLEVFRREGEHFRDLSFPTISGAGSNGAIVHYHATPKTEKHLEQGSIYLVDSGAQYLDGTTDVTRAVAIGEPTSEMRDRFTRVLKGMIAVAMSRFPKGTTGSQLDVLARASLWQAGIDFDHGTGHGVGSYLGVHEGPQRISKAPNAQALLPGMIVSDEPGYYKTGGYGIRIENLVVVIQGTPIAHGERDMLAFETLTLAPIDRSLIEPSLLTPAETAWLDEYHARVRQEISPLVDDETRHWLAAATQPLIG